jgi:transposase
MAAVAITRLDHTAQDLRTAAKRSDDVAAARRMLALALVLEGKSRSEAATFCGMDRQSLRDWVHRYNAEGLEGLRNSTAPGRSRGFHPSRNKKWRNWCGRGRIWPSTAWCAGGGSTSRG